MVGSDSVSWILYSFAALSFLLLPPTSRGLPRKSTAWELGEEYNTGEKG